MSVLMLFVCFPWLALFLLPSSCKRVESFSFTNYIPLTDLTYEHDQLFIQGEKTAGAITLQLPCHTQAEEKQKWKDKRPRLYSPRVMKAIQLRSNNFVNGKIRASFSVLSDFSLAHIGVTVAGIWHQGAKLDAPSNTPMNWDSNRRTSSHNTEA